MEKFGIGIANRVQLPGGQRLTAKHGKRGLLVYLQTKAKVPLRKITPDESALIIATPCSQGALVTCLIPEPGQLPPEKRQELTKSAQDLSAILNWYAEGGLPWREICNMVNGIRALKRRLSV